MPANRKPTNVLKMSGAFDKDPARGRARRDEPVPEQPLDVAPAYFTDAQNAAWAEVVKIAPPGVIFDSDRIALEAMAVLLAQFRTNQAEFKAPMMLRLESLLGRFGLTPADRSRVVAAHKEPENPFARVHKK